MHLYLLTFQAFDETRLMRDPTPTEIAFLVANYVCCIPVICAVGLFSLYHFWNLLENVRKFRQYNHGRWLKDTTADNNHRRRRDCQSQEDGQAGQDPAGRSLAYGPSASDTRPQTQFPFNVGLVTNFTSILGHTPGEWLFGSGPSGDGLSYPSITGTEPLRWPPRDPYENLRDSWAREAEIQRSRYPPYHPKYQALDAQDEEDEEDEVPLAELRQRNVRIRRGSEGFEVRPNGVHTPSEEGEENEAEDRQDGSLEDSWEELFDKRKALYDSGSDDDDE